MSYYSQEEPQERPIQRRGFSLPGMDRNTYLTWALLAINLGIWLLMEAVGDSESQETLLRFGAMFGPLIASGEYWRLFTAMFLHVGLMHLLFNGFGLLIFGRLVERIYGHNRFITIYLLAGLSGSVASYTFNRIAIGAGASGAIFGILGAMAAFFVARRDTLGDMGRQNLTGIAIIAAINLVFGFIMPGIDNWAHMGGLLGGFLLGLAFAPKYQLQDTYGFSSRIRDVTSIMKRWWVIPAMIGVLVLGTWLATNNASDVSRAQVLIVRSDRLLEEQKVDEALNEINRAIELNERSGPAFFIRGKIYAEIGNPDLAMADLRAATSLGLDSGSQQEAIRLMLELGSRNR